MADTTKEKIRVILEAAGSVRQEINHVCGHYEILAYNLKQEVVG